MLAWHLQVEIAKKDPRFANSFSDTKNTPNHHQRWQCDERKPVEEGPNINPTVTVSAEQKYVVRKQNECHNRTIEQQNIHREG